MTGSATQTLVTDVWVPATWETFVAVARSAVWEEARCYYDDGWMRIEMAALGPLHGRDNTVLAMLVGLFATLKNLPVVGFTNTSFTKVGLREAQPDLAFYIGDGRRLPPQSNAPVEVNGHDAPTLVVEVASTSLEDDLGRKRLLYERLGVGEYWVVDVMRGEVLAFAVAAGRSGEVRVSEVLPGLALDLVEEALARGRREDDGAIGRWLIEVFR